MDDFRIVLLGVDGLMQLKIATGPFLLPGMVSPSFETACAAVVQAAADMDKAPDVSAAAARTRREPVTYCGGPGASAYSIGRELIRQQAEVIHGLSHAAATERAKWLDRLTPKLAALDELKAAVEWEAANILPTAHPDNAQPAGEGQDAAAAGEPSRRKGTVNTRMLELTQRNLARVAGWTAKQWAAELRCVPSAVVATPSWKDLAMARERQRAEKAADRRRRKRPAKRD